MFQVEVKIGKKLVNLGGASFYVPEGDFHTYELDLVGDLDLKPGDRIDKIWIDHYETFGPWYATKCGSDRVVLFCTHLA